MSKDEHFGRHFLGGLLRLSPLDSAKYLYLTVWLRPLTIQLLKDNYIPEFIYRHLLSQQLSYKSVNVHKVESAGFMSSCHLPFVVGQRSFSPACHYACTEQCDYVLFGGSIMLWAHRKCEGVEWYSSSTMTSFKHQIPAVSISGFFSWNDRWMWIAVAAHSIQSNDRLTAAIHM